MTEQELYIYLLSTDSNFGNLPKFDAEFLKNYEIAKLLLEKFGIDCLEKEQQRSLNLEAVFIWIRSSNRIHLKYDIPEILELLPETIEGGLSLLDSEVQSLNNLKSIMWGLDLRNSKIKSLPNLESVGGNLLLSKSKIQNLSKLQFVWGWFNLARSEIQSLPELRSAEGLLLQGSQVKFLPELRHVGSHLNLKSEIKALPNLETVGGLIYASTNKIKYWKNYFSETGRPALAKKVSS